MKNQSWIEEDLVFKKAEPWERKIKCSNQMIKELMMEGKINSKKIKLESTSLSTKQRGNKNKAV